MSRVRVLLAAVSSSLLVGFAVTGTGVASPPDSTAVDDTTASQSLVPSPTATEGVCPAPTEGSVPTSTPASSDSEALREGDLPPGQYTTNSFEPSLVFMLPDGWHQFFPDDADEIALGGPGAELNITRPAEVIDPDTGAPVEAPDSLLEWFTDHSRLDASEPVEVQVDCIDSHHVDLTAPTADVALFHYPSGDMRLPAGVSTRVYIVPLEGPDLVALILPPAGANDFDAVLRQAEPIVLSLAIND
jgi:hypothetical protein